LKTLPGYLELIKIKELENRVQALHKMLGNCNLCPHQCSVDRLNGEKGFCRTGKNAIVSGYNAHFGEERELVGRYGSGTIFFSYCNLRCVFCQNYEISQCGEGDETTPAELARVMLALQKYGCHNINLVSPSHVVPQIVEAVYLAAKKGLNIPIVYNSGGYDLVDTLKMLEGIIDIYMPDIKFSDEFYAQKYSGVKDYFRIVKKAVQEMHRQVGDLKVDQQGIAYRGLIVRHLVLPDGLAGTEKIMEFLAREISPDTYVNIMAQYHPEHYAYKYPELSKRITGEDYRNAIEAAKKAGLKNIAK